MEFKNKVVDIYPDAICKRIGIDNGHGFKKMFCVFKRNSTLVGDAISNPMPTANKAWEDAAKIITIKNNQQ